MVTTYVQNCDGTHLINFGFKKAFHSVPHPQLLAKLKASSILGLLLSYINALLSWIDAF
jgi:hypothetical protein